MNEEALLAIVEESDQPLLVVLTGAGISAESGLKTFRDADGLWENHPVHEVASIDGWHANPELVLEFYNQRRAQLMTVAPNAGHHALKTLEAKYRVVVITQNVDDLHERAGSTHIVHLHGELRKVRTVADADWTDDIGGAPIRLGDRGPDGTQLRPYIVWFGEEVPLLPLAARITSRAAVLLVVGTSLAVYPAASLIDYAPADCPKYYIDPRPASIHGIRNLEVIAEAAGTGLPKLAERLMA